MSVVTTSRRWFTGRCLAHVVELGVAQLVLPAVQGETHTLGAGFLRVAACPVAVRWRVAVVPVRGVPAPAQYLGQSAPVLFCLLSAHTTHNLIIIIRSTRSRRFTRDLVSVPAPLNAYTALQLCFDHRLHLFRWRRPGPLATRDICF